MCKFLRYLIMMLCAVSLGLSLHSCKDDTKIIYVGSVSVTTSTNPLQTDFLGTRFVAYVNCSGKGWRATCASDWVKLSATEGLDGDIIYMQVAENAIDEKRLAVVRFYDIDDPYTLSDHVEIIQTPSSNSENALLTAQMDRKHRLGYGYDIFGAFASDSSFSKLPIFDYEHMLLLEKNFGRVMITENLRHLEELEIISATTLTELNTTLTQTEEKGSLFMGCGKTTKTESEILNTKTSDQECGMIRLKQIVSSRTIDVGEVTEFIRQENGASLYSADFLKAINTIKQGLVGKQDIDTALMNMYQNFGSHLVVSADLGGEIRINTVIDRVTSICAKHSVETISKKLFGDVTSETSNKYDSYGVNEQLNYQIELTMTGGDSTAQAVIKNKVDKFKINNQINSNDIIRWQNSIHLPIGATANNADYNAAMVNCRLIPLYEIINDTEVADAYKRYLFTINAIQESPSDEKEPATCSLSDIKPASPESEETELFAQSIYVGNDLRAVIGSEYIPTIRSDKPCLVAYPIIAGRPFMYAGVFVGDSKHLPGMVRWLGNNCLYEPEECFGSDSLGYKSLLDENGQLKTLYLYWGGVQMYPNSQVNCTATGTHQTTRMKVSENLCTQENPCVVKVGPHYWTRTPMVLKIDGQPMDTYQYKGLSYLSVTGEPRTWTSKKYAWSHLLPNIKQAQSVMGFLNGRYQMLENSYFTNVGVTYSDRYNSNLFVGANMLGLNWDKGLIEPYNRGKENEYCYVSDENSWIVPTYEEEKIYITRLGMSGKSITFTFEDYINAGWLIVNPNYPIFVPFYLCTDEVY